MNDVGGSVRGTGLRAGKSSRNSDANFEYEDSEWDVGIGNLIIDLDADIEKSNEEDSSGGNSTTTTTSAAAASGKSTKSKKTTTSSKSTAGKTAGNSVNSSGGEKAAAAPRGDKSNKGNSTSGSGNNNSNSSPTKKNGGNSKSSSAAAGSSQQGKATNSVAPSMHIPRSSEGASGPSTTAANVVDSVSSSTVTTSSTTASTPTLGTTTLKSGKGALITQQASSSSVTSLGGKLSSSLDSVGKGNSNMNSNVDHSPGTGGGLVGDKGELKMKIKKLKSGAKNIGGAKHEIVRNDGVAASSGKNSSSSELKSKGDNKAKADGPDKESNKSISNNDQDASSSIKNDSHSDKNSSSSKGTNKRGSNTHKKVKGALPNESSSSSSSTLSSSSKSNSTLANSSGGSVHNSSSSKGKKDDSKLGLPNSNSIANSHGKETGSHSSSSVKASSSSGNISSSSAAGKLSSGNNSFSNHNANTTDLGFSHSNTGASGSFGNAVSTTLTVGNNNSAFKSALTSSSGNWASGSPVKNNAGGDKGRLSPSAGIASDKSSAKTHSPSMGKKPRALGQSDRSLSQEEGTSHALAVNSGTGNSGTSSSYRTSVTLSSASLNDLSPGSIGQGTAMPATRIPVLSDAPFKTNLVSMPSAANGKQDVCVGTSVGTVTEPDCLGPCEPGTSVTLEGIVWHETESGILVVNVTWRGKTYVGTLMDCTKADWAPPRFCDSPTSDLEMRTPKNRAKRGRGQAGTPVNDPAPAEARQGNPKLRNGVKGRRGSSTNSGFATPVSPLKGDSWQKRKTRGSEVEEEVKTAKRAKVVEVKNGAAAKERQSASPAPTSGENSLIECPEPNCSKKYKHINGLKYHQSHAHSNSTVLLEDSDSNMSSASGTIAEGKSGGNNSDMVDGNDADIMEVDTTDGENTSSAPTTPAKRSKELSDKVYDINADLDLKDETSYPAKMRVLKVTATSASVGKEGDKDGIRVPILSVPVYSVSAQSRHEEKDGVKGNVIKGATTWQPNVISSSSSPVALSVPVVHSHSSSKEGKSKDQKDRPADASQSKKNKHKKKSKDKDRERERDSQKGSNGVGELSGNKSPMQSGLKSRDSLDKRSSSLEELRAEKEVPQSTPQNPISGKPTAEVQPMTEVSHADPRSPAYSDISDANDSGPENDLSKKDVVPIMSGIADLNAAGKKDSVVGIPPGHGISPFFPSFYAPFIDPNKSGDGRDADVGPDGKPKPKAHLPHHLQVASTGPAGSPEGHRSPLRENIPGKFPPHYFAPHGHGPYMGYYDYAGASAPPPPPQPFSDGNYAAGARKMDDKDRNKPEKSDSLALIRHIKLEPGAEKERGKEDHEVHHHHHHHEKSDREGNHLPEKRPLGLLPNQHIIPCNKHAASKDAKRAAAEREREQREREEREAKRNEKNKESESDKDKQHNEGSKPTMETTGPPPPPTAGSYDRIPYHHAYLPGGPFGYVDHGLYRQMMGPPFPGFHPSPAPRFPHLGGGLMPEDLSRPGGPPGGPKALDVLSQHAAQYYASASHKIHELQERALKSPNPQIQMNSGVIGNLPGAPGSPSGIPERGGRGSIVGGTPGTGPPSAPGSGPKPADLSKDIKPLIVPGHSPESRSPPTQHHVHSHTHHHTHVGIGYPIIPTVPPQYSPHYGVIPSPAPPAAVAASVITPFPPPKST